MKSVTRELTTMLPPEAGSVGRARHVVAEAMTTGGHHDLVDVATLLVSEVVTNSVLHAGTEIRLTCRRSRAGVRVEVFDRSPLLPTVRHYDVEATTGRGLDLVSALAACWGIDCAEDGKTLWFELGDGPGGHEARPSTDAVAESSPAPEGAFEVHLRGASPHLLQAVIEHGDALLRELALLAFAGELEGALPEGWHLPQFDVSPVLAAADAAAAPEARADLKVHLPAGADTAASERLRLVDHADALARDGRLLSAPALPEVAVCRHWLYTQIAEQAAGVPPRAWRLSEPLEPVRVAAALPEDELERLERTAAATIVADDANRIIFVNQAAGELLGWTPGALIGQRLTVLIPAELREAHLAGFSRLQVTGKPRILGSMLHVPALRRDGSCVEVALMIEQLADLGGRSAFRAVLAATGEDGRGRSPVP